MPRYTVNLDQKLKVWQNNTISLDFDGTAEELKEFLENQDSLSELVNTDYLHSEYIFETEEPLTASGEGSPVIEVKSVDEEL